MQGIDPKFTFWFGAWTNFLLFTAAYGVDHAPAIVQVYAPTVQWVCGYLGQANGVLLTIMAGISSNKVGPLVAPPK